jgi:hypothetical protein
MKKFEDVQVHTKESDKVYESVKEGAFPVPLYASMPTEDEIKEHGLYVIGKSVVKTED